MADPNAIILPSVDSDIIHTIALQSDYVARYAELAEVCRVAILRATAAASLITAAATATAGAGGGGGGRAASNKDILAAALTVLTSSIPECNVKPQAYVNGAIKSKLFLAFSLYTVLTAATVATAAEPTTPDAAITTVKDECSKALQKFRLFYVDKKDNITDLNAGLTEAQAILSIDAKDLSRVFRRPQTGGKRPKNKKTQKKSRKSRK